MSAMLLCMMMAATLAASPSEQPPTSPASIFRHEGMHQWDAVVSAFLSEHARRIDKRVPPGLSHAMIFYTAGEAVRRVIAGHVPSADALGVWGRGFQSMKAPLEDTWKPYLDGRGTRDEALTELVAKTASERRR